ncbi:MAG: hypothetical protein HOV94_29935 [Saccharothrix sp.]|nr:hypothetical protein [Saccharothrix sp.]
MFKATLSFLGLGIGPPAPSRDNMLAEPVGYYRVAGWFVIFPGAALLSGAVVLWLISLVVFLLFYAAPSDVARPLAGWQANETQITAIRDNPGLDDPLPVQYGRFLGGHRPSRPR